MYPQIDNYFANAFSAGTSRELKATRMGKRWFVAIMENNSVIQDRDGQTLVCLGLTLTEALRNLERQLFDSLTNLNKPGQEELEPETEDEMCPICAAPQAGDPPCPQHPKK